MQYCLLFNLLNVSCILIVKLTHNKKYYIYLNSIAKQNNVLLKAKKHDTILVSILVSYKFKHSYCSLRAKKEYLEKN